MVQEAEPACESAAREGAGVVREEAGVVREAELGLHTAAWIGTSDGVVRDGSAHLMVLEDVRACSNSPNDPPGKLTKGTPGAAMTDGSDTDWDASTCASVSTTASSGVGTRIEPPERPQDDPPAQRPPTSPSASQTDSQQALGPASSPPAPRADLPERRGHKSRGSRRRK